MMIIDRDMLWRQYEAAINMLDEALRNCPDELWEKQLWADEPDQWVAQGFSRFWYVGYHTLFWLDLYLTGAEEGFAPPTPFDLVEMVAGEVLPHTYSREALLGYLQFCRQKCQNVIAGLSSEQAGRICEFGWGRVSFAELQLYNLRHVQEHGAHLSMFLGQHAAHQKMHP